MGIIRHVGIRHLKTSHTMFKSALMLVLCSTAATAVKSPKHVIFYLIDDYGFADASYKAAMYVKVVI